MKPEHLTNAEALELIYVVRRLSEDALLAYHLPERAYFQNTLAASFDQVFELMQSINDARRHRRALAEIAREEEAA
jgi:hypothetical protein